MSKSERTIVLIISALAVAGCSSPPPKVSRKTAQPNANSKSLSLTLEQESDLKFIVHISNNTNKSVVVVPHTMFLVLYVRRQSGVIDSLTQDGSGIDWKPLDMFEAVALSPGMSLTVPLHAYPARMRPGKGHYYAILKPVYAGDFKDTLRHEVKGAPLLEKEIRSNEISES